MKCHVKPSNLQIWPAEVKDSVVLEHIQNKLLQPQKVRHHALLEIYLRKVMG